MSQQSIQLDHFSKEMCALRGAYDKLKFWEKPEQQNGDYFPVENDKVKTLKKFRNDYNKKKESLGIKFKTPKEEEAFWKDDDEKLQVPSATSLLSEITGRVRESCSQSCYDMASSGQKVRKQPCYNETIPITGPKVSKFGKSGMRQNPYCPICWNSYAIYYDEANEECVGICNKCRRYDILSEEEVDNYLHNGRCRMWCCGDVGAYVHGDKDYYECDNCHKKIPLSDDIKTYLNRN